MVDAVNGSIFDGNKNDHYLETQLYFTGLKKILGPIGPTLYYMHVSLVSKGWCAGTLLRAVCHLTWAREVTSASW